MISKHFNPFNSVVAESTTTTHTPITETPEADRPREKLLAKGVDALTIAELLAILIGSGTRKKTAVELMDDIMTDCNGKLAILSRMTVEELMQYDGIGEAKALSIVAAAEIGRRRLEEKVSDIERFTDSKVIHEFMRPRIQDISHEESWAFLLNSDCRLLKFTHLSKGGLTETNVDVRLLLKHALLANATNIILVHNHPSGNLRPSHADDTLTHNVQKAAHTMNIRLLDHVIVTDADYYSYAENGKI